MVMAAVVRFCTYTPPSLPSLCFLPGPPCPAQSCFSTAPALLQYPLLGPESAVHPAWSFQPAFGLSSCRIMSRLISSHLISYDVLDTTRHDPAHLEFMSIYLSIYLSIHPSIYLYINPSIHQSITFHSKSHLKSIITTIYPTLPYPPPSSSKKPTSIPHSIPTSSSLHCLALPYLALPCYVMSAYALRRDVISPSRHATPRHVETARCVRIAHPLSYLPS
jgi:hypothetical protein